MFTIQRTGGEPGARFTNDSLDRPTVAKAGLEPATHGL
jgi:hypothetical protein